MFEFDIPPTTMLVYVVSVVVVIVTVLCYLDVKKPLNYPPGPKWLPIIGNYTYFRQRLQKLKFHHLVWDELAKKHGPVVGLRLGRTLVVAVSGTANVKEVLNRDEFDGRPDGFFFRLRTFGKRLGVVFTDGPFWQTQRKFVLQHLRNFGLGRKEMEHRIEEEARELMDTLRKQCSQPILMHNAFDVSVINVLWIMLAGERYALDDARLLKLLGIVHDAFRSVDMSGGLITQMPFLRYIIPNASGYNLVMQILKRMWNFLEETVAEHRKYSCSSHSRDLIDSFLNEMSTNTSDTTFTDEQLLSICLDLFMAGSETTSNTLGFAVLYMLKYPEVQRKVQDELTNVVGSNRWPSTQDRSNLPYTEAVLMEIQRCANVPPLGIAHRVVRDVDLCGYTIPEGTLVLTNLFSVHMDEAYWEKPFEFNPERFINENGRLDVPENCFLPFGQGRRRCLGESLAKTSYFSFFTALLHNFTLETAPDSHEVSLEGYDGITISPKPFKAVLKPRFD